MSTEAVLIDTHVAMWLFDGSIKPEALAIILEAGLRDACFVSPVTAWEVGILARLKRYKFEPDPQAWFDMLLAHLSLTETLLTSRILLESNLLPGDLHGDPANRMLVATARTLDCALLTHDAKILAYAAQGHVKAIAC